MVIKFPYEVQVIKWDFMTFMTNVFRSFFMTFYDHLFPKENFENFLKFFKIFFPDRKFGSVDGKFGRASRKFRPPNRIFRSLDRKKSLKKNFFLDPKCLYYDCFYDFITL